MNCDCTGNTPINNILNNINNQHKDQMQIPNYGNNTNMNQLNNNLNNYGNVGNQVDLSNKGTNIDLIRNMNQQNKEVINNINSQPNPNFSLNSQPTNNKVDSSFSNNVANNVAKNLDNVYNKTSNVVQLSSGFLFALALNEVVKVYINRSIKFNRGSTNYYLYYLLVVFIVAIFVNSYKK